MSSGAPTISLENFRKLQEAGQTRVKKTGEKKGRKKAKVSYEALCLLPEWTASTPFGVTQYRLPMPPSANTYWRHVVVRGRATVLVSQEARNYKESVAMLAKRLGMPKLTGNVCVRLQVHRSRKSGDLDNRIKVTLDALKGIAFVDDEQVVHIDVRRFEAPGNPHIVISIEEASMTELPHEPEPSVSELLAEVERLRAALKARLVA